MVAAYAISPCRAYHGDPEYVDQDSAGADVVVHHRATVPRPLAHVEHGAGRFKNVEATK